MIVFDHTYPEWNIKRTKTNGAFTYSKDIIKHYLPILQKKESDKGVKIVVSTASQLDKCKYDFLDDVDYAIQFLHKYPYGEPTEKKQIEDIINWLRIRKFKGKIIFLSAYQAYVDKINSWFKGVATAVFVPMVVDIDLQSTKDYSKRRSKKVIWFGNSYADKNKYMNVVAQWLNREGHSLDIIQNGNYNYTTKITNHDQIYDILQNYKFGIGVGRCAIEMLECGLNVAICGQNFGGVITDNIDYMLQKKNNFNGRTITYDREISTCLSWLINSGELRVKPTTKQDIEDVKTTLYNL